MAFRLTVAGSLEPLADVLADELERPVGSDPFAPELVVIPGDGVRTWLNARLAHRLGATPTGADGIVANLDIVFPATLVRAALGEHPGLGRWAVGPLGWAVHHAVAEHDELGISADAVRARAIADLFDRYALHRPTMVVGWSQGRDVDGVGAPLPEHHRWQPRLWRAVQGDLGGPSDVERTIALTAALRSTTPAADLGALPSRVFVFGLATLPPLHLDVLTALATHIDVHVLAPTPSPGRWLAVRDQLRPPLPLPVPRGDDLVPVGQGHPLITNWGRTSREAHVLLLDASAELAGAVIDPPDLSTPPDQSAPLLAHVRHDLRNDTAIGSSPRPDDATGDDLRPVLDPADRSVRWHRCHGTTRQVEVLRDALLHVLEERGGDDTPLFEPRDIAVLSPDVARFAPLVEAVFAGDPHNGLPAIPVRVADRSLRQDDPLLDAAGALLDLLDGRFRASAVLAFASRSAVRHRFGLDTVAIGRLSEWVEATNVRWGLRPDDQASFGLPDDLDAHTWQAGLDQLLVGLAMSSDGTRLGPGAVAPYPRLRREDIDTLGAIAELVHELARAATALRTPAPVDAWCDALASAMGALCAVPDDEAWRWRGVEIAIESFRDEANVDDTPRPETVDPVDLATLFRRRLAGANGRPRFGTGAVTVSSLTAQRGVPHRVVCILGLDDDVAAGSFASTEDLTGDPPCVGDRDARSEQRSQLLDAVLAAGDRLILLSTGHDLRTNTGLPPIVPLAELLDVVDATVRAPEGGSARRAITVDHPRQSWARDAFVAGALDGDGPWSFDTGALDAAWEQGSSEIPPFLPEPLEEPERDGPINLDALVETCTRPTELLLRRRLGVSQVAEAHDHDDRIPLTLDPLDRWKLADALLDGRLDPAGPWSASDEAAWEQHERRRGAVPPLGFGDEAINTATTLTQRLVDTLDAELGAETYAPRTLEFDLPLSGADGDPWRLAGRVPGACASTLVTVTASTLKAKHLLTAWVHLAAVTADDPGRPWRALVIGRGAKKESLGVQRLTLRSPDAALEVLNLLRDLHRRAVTDAVPFFPDVTRALHLGDEAGARKHWEGKYGERNDRWISLVFPFEFDELRAAAPRADEQGPGWPSGPSRLERWAGRVWGAVDATAAIEEDQPRPADAGAGPP